MKHVTRPVRARGAMPATAALAALAALLVLAPFASATSDPVASGTTTVTFKKGFYKKLKKAGIKVLKVSPGKVKGRKITLSVSGGSMDPTNGLGNLELSGGIKFKRGKKTAPVNTLLLDTAKSSLTGKVGGRQMKLANLAGLTYSRNGFGVNVNLKKLKLTGKAVKQLNRKLGYSGKKKTSEGKAPRSPFRKNQVMGRAFSEAQPKTVAVLATGEARLVLSAAALEKLKRVGPPAGEAEGPFAVKLSPVPPTTIVDPGPPPTVAFPIGGGTIGPTASAGVLQTAGGLKLEQSLEAVGQGTTVLTMGNIWVDLGAKTATVEVTIQNDKNAELNKGSLGRASIADIQLTGATIVSDPVARTVSVQNATATLQGITAETLNAVFIDPIEKATMEPQEKFAAGDPLGTFSFTAQTQ